MINKIICPTDFSKAADNGLEYAAKFAQVLGAELLLVNLQRLFPATAAVSMAEGMTSNVRENALLISDRLNETSTVLNKMFDISVTSEVDLTTDSLIGILSSCINKSMVVMGSNGADDLFQRVFGSTTYRVIRSTKSPVLMVPEQVSFGSPKKIVLAWDYTQKALLSFALLKTIMQKFNSEIILLHVNVGSHLRDYDEQRALRSEVLAIAGTETDVEFEEIDADSVSDGLNSYMLKYRADILALSYHKKNLISTIFGGGIAKRISNLAQFPTLALHT